jgi:hypothetical protein
LGIFGKRYYAPAGMFEKCSMEEIAEADSAFVACSQSKNLDKLYLLVAILYRPKRNDLADFKKSINYNGDLREPFNSQHVRDTALILKKKLPLYKAIAVFLFYWHFREKEMINDAVLKIIFQGTDKKEGLDLGWLQTLIEVSNTKFGTFNETIQQNWLLVMYSIANEMDKAKQKAAKDEEREIRSKFNK